MPINRDVNQLPEDIKEFLDITNQRIDDMNNKTRNTNFLLKEMRDLYGQLARRREVLNRLEKEGSHFTAEQRVQKQQILDQMNLLESKSKTMGIAGNIGAPSGGKGGAMAGIQNFLGAAGSIPGLGGLASVSRMLPGVGSVVGATRAIGELMKETDKLTRTFAESRRNLSLPGVETWRAGWLDMARYRAELGKSMREMTEGAKGAEEAMTIIGALREKGAFQELSYNGRQVNEMFKEMEKDLKSGSLGDRFHDTAQNMGELAAMIDNMGEAYGVNRGELIKQAVSLQRYTRSRDKDVGELLKQWHMVAYTANEAGVSLQDYTQWVQEAEKQLRFYGFGLEDINAVAYKFADSLKSGVTSLDSMSDYIGRITGELNIPREALFGEYMQKNMGGMSPDVRRYMGILRDELGGEGMLMVQRGLREGADLTKLPVFEGIARALPEEMRTKEFFEKVAKETNKVYADFAEKGLPQMLGGTTPGALALLGGTGVLGEIDPSWEYLKKGPMGKGAEQQRMNLDILRGNSEISLELEEKANRSFEEMSENFKQFRTVGASIKGLFETIAGTISEGGTQGGNAMRVIPLAPMYPAGSWYQPVTFEGAGR